MTRPTPPIVLGGVGMSETSQPPPALRTRPTPPGIAATATLPSQRSCSIGRRRHLPGHEGDLRHEAARRVEFQFEVQVATLARERPSAGSHTVPFRPFAQCHRTEPRLGRPEGSLDIGPIRGPGKAHALRQRGTWLPEDTREQFTDPLKVRVGLGHGGDRQLLKPRRQFRAQQDVDPHPAVFAAQPPGDMRRRVGGWARRRVTPKPAVHSPQPLEFCATTWQRFVEFYVHREEGLRDVVIPSIEETLHRGLRRDRCRPRAYGSDPTSLALQDRADRFAHRFEQRGVAGVRECDHADPGTRVPTHLRTVSGISATVRPRSDPTAKWSGHRIVLTRSRRRPETARHPRTRQATSGLNDRWTCCISRLVPRDSGCELRAVAWRERIGEAGYPTRNITHRGEEAAHRGERAVRVDRLLEPQVVPPDISDRQRFGGHPVSREGRRCHTERGEEARCDELRIRHAGGTSHDETQDRVAEVGVLEPRPGGPGKGHTVLQEGQRNVPSSRPCCRSPQGSSVGNPADMVKRCSIVIGVESPVGNSRPASSGIHDDTESSSLSRPFVAQHHHGRSGEALGHRRDSEDAVLVWSSVHSVPGGTESATQGELAVDDDAIGDPRRHAPRFQLLEDLVDLVQAVRQRLRLHYGGRPGKGGAAPDSSPGPLRIHGWTAYLAIQSCQRFWMIGSWSLSTTTSKNSIAFQFSGLVARVASSTPWASLSAVLLGGS